jgi:hypothetical protein
MHEQKIKPVIPRSQQVSINDLYTFLAAVVQMGHNHKPSMELCWTKGGLYRVPFCSSVMPRDHFLIVLKHLYFVDSLKPITQDREDPNYDRLWDVRQTFDIQQMKQW